MSKGIEGEVVCRSGPLSGLSLLVVEDDALLAMEMDELIRSLGAEVVGPFARILPALDAMHRAPVAGAILDVRLNGDTTFSIVDALIERGNPVLLVTGGAEESLPEKYRHIPRLQKPFDPAELAQLAVALFRGRQGGPARAGSGPPLHGAPLDGKRRS